MNKCSVDIFDLAYDGARGVGKTPEGKIVFVPKTVPGEKVLIQITKEKKNYCQGKVLEILEKSRHRVTPKCPVYDQCGGCNLQHITYQEQTQQKQELLKQLIQRSGLEITLLDFVPSDIIWGYRNRLEAHFENGSWGFFMPKSHKLVFTKECPVSDSRLVQTLNSLKSKKEHVHVALTDTNNEDVVITKGRHRGLKGLFSQVNNNVNEKLKAFVLSKAKSLHWQEVLDFYAGSGNFGLNLAKIYPNKIVHCVELSESLVAEGQNKAKKLKNLKWHQGPCEDYKFPTSLPVSLAILNPPRSGCNIEVLKSILEQKNIRHILYISCNPPNGFRDLKALSQKFKVKSLQGFDMFPQTIHFETVFLLERIK